MKKLIILLLLMSFSELFSQAPSGEFSYHKVVQSNDTLIVNRKNGNWWFGLRGGFNRNYFFGSLQYTTNNDPGNPFKRIVNFDIGDGGGALLGLMAEYVPVNEKIGYGINVNLIENRSVNTSSEPDKDILQTYYDFNSTLNYLVISPYMNYSLILSGLYTFTGLDIAINSGQKTSFQKKFINSGFIEQWKVEDLEQLPISVGFHIGFGYDFFIADISEVARARFSPFVSMHLNSSMIADNSSTWSSLQIKLGFAVKLGFDKIQYDTLFYDKDHVPSPVFIAAVNKGTGTSFPGFRKSEEFVGADLLVVDIPIVTGEITAKKTAEDLAKDNPNATPEILEVPARLKFNFNSPYDFSFTNSATTDLSNDMKRNIENMANFLKSNPKIKVFIVGYSDNAGSFVENDTRSRQRAQKAEQEFIKNGINKSRISFTWRGSLGNKANNDTEEGRRQNRRVEITLIK